MCYPFETSKKGPLLTVIVPGSMTMSTLAGSYFLDGAPATSNTKWVGEPDFRFIVLSFWFSKEGYIFLAFSAVRVKEQ